MREALRKELEQLEKENDKITPELLVNFAKSHPHSEAHRHFNWDVKAAAMEYWLATARKILSVWVTVIDDDGPKEFRAVFSLSSPTNENLAAREYVSTRSAMAHADTRRQMIFEMLKRISGILASYPLKELQPLSRLVERLLRAHAPKKAA